MKEQLYTIPVNDIFDKPCECPVCAMKLKLENDAVAFAMGPSYMEDDSAYHRQNRLLHPPYADDVRF